MENDGQKTKKSTFFLLIRVGITVLACWMVLKDLDFSQLADTFSQLHILILAQAAAAYLIGVGLIGLRWWVFMRAQEIHVPLWLAVKLTFLGQFFTNFMPSAVGGDLARAWYVSLHTHKRLQAVLGVVVDRVMGLVATLILAVVSYCFFMRGQGIFQTSRKESEVVSGFFAKHPVSGYQILLGVVILAGIGFVLSDMFDLKQLFSRFYRSIIHFLGQLKEAVMVYYHHPLVLMFGLFITLFLQSLVIVSYWLVGRDLGMTAGVQFYFVFFPLIWVVGSIPISIAGLGILEGGLVILFVQFTGAPPEAAIALALCQRLTWIVASIPGMLVHLTGAHRHNPVGNAGVPPA